MRAPSALLALIGAMLSACQSTGDFDFPDAADRPNADAYATPDDAGAPDAEARDVAPDSLPQSEPQVLPYADRSGSAMDAQEAELRRGFARADVSVLRDGGNLVLQLDSAMLFAAETSALTPRGRSIVASLSDVFKRYPSTFIDIDGFSAVSRGLSQDRADAVAIEFERAGIRSNRLSALGHADELNNMGPRLEITLEPSAG